MTLPRYSPDGEGRGVRPTMVTGSQPALWRILVQLRALCRVAPVDVGGLAREAGPGHATLIPVDCHIPADPGSSRKQTLPCLHLSELMMVPATGCNVDRTGGLRCLL